jgi:hypothetical protein
MKSSETGWSITFVDDSGDIRYASMAGQISEEEAIRQWFRRNHPDWQIVGMLHYGKKVGENGLRSD